MQIALIITDKSAQWHSKISWMPCSWNTGIYH